MNADDLRAHLQLRALRGESWLSVPELTALVDHPELTAQVKLSGEIARLVDTARAAQGVGHPDLSLTGEGSPALAYLRGQPVRLSSDHHAWNAGQLLAARLMVAMSLHPTHAATTGLSVSWQSRVNLNLDREVALAQLAALNLDATQARTLLAVICAQAARTELRFPPASTDEARRQALIRSTLPREWLRAANIGLFCPHGETQVTLSWASFRRAASTPVRSRLADWLLRAGDQLAGLPGRQDHARLERALQVAWAPEMRSGDGLHPHALLLMALQLPEQERRGLLGALGPSMAGQLSASLDELGPPPRRWRGTTNETRALLRRLT